MSFKSTTITIGCDKIGCRKEHSVTGKNTTRMQLFKSAKAAGWDWKSAARQFCPDHSSKNGTVKPSVLKAKKASASKPRKSTKAVMSEVSKEVASTFSS